MWTFFSYKAPESGLGVALGFFVAMFLDSMDGVFPPPHVKATVSVVGGYKPGCTDMCWCYGAALCFKRK